MVIGVARISKQEVTGIFSRKPTKVSASIVLKDIRVFAAFGFGSGLSPIVPGTMGTIAAIPFLLVFSQLAWPIYLLVVLLSVLIGIHLCDYTTKVLGVHDHGGIVWDEFVGFWVAMAFVPINWKTVLVGFVLFRFFDMVKPWPISKIDETVKGGWGIILDDILAGIATLGAVHALMYWSLI